MDTRRLALLSVLTSLCLGVQLMARPMNVELTSLITFVTGMVFGSLYGGSLGALVMFVNGFLSPYGFAGAVMPFQIAGMGLIGVIGGLYARMANGKVSVGRFAEAAILGALLTFIYDVITNIGTAAFLMFSGLPFPQAFVAALISGAIPSVIHVSSNTTLFGWFTVPVVYAMNKMLGRR